MFIPPSSVNSLFDSHLFNIILLEKYISIYDNNKIAVSVESMIKNSQAILNIMIDVSSKDSQLKFSIYTLTLSLTLITCFFNLHKKTSESLNLLKIFLVFL